MKNIFLSTVITVSIPCSLLAQVQKVEEFEMNGTRVAVSFFNPSESFTKKNPEIRTCPPKQQAEAWYTNLQQEAIYLFTCSNKTSGKKLYFIIRGNPSIKDSAHFYQIEVVDGTSLDLINPNLQKYSEFVLSRSKFPEAHGGLFEHLLPKEKQKMYARNGIQLFNGIYDYVNAYDDIKSGFTRVFNEYTNTK